MREYEEEQQLERKKSKVLVENNAGTIFDNLTELINLGGIHERRWLWELLQNAKDSVPESRQVSVAIDFENGSLSFRHNGTAFSDDEIIHLIYHGSTKKGQKDKTGKFGTGFLTTHLLSRRVVVSGVLDSDRAFEFMLDRSGSNPKAIECAMEASWEEFKKSQANIGANGFTTSYTYTLNDEGRQIAQKGLRDLPRLMPFVLAFNSKFQSISLNSSEARQSFTRGCTQHADGSPISIVTIDQCDLKSRTSSNTHVVMATDGDVTGEYWGQAFYSCES